MNNTHSNIKQRYFLKIAIVLLTLVLLLTLFSCEKPDVGESSTEALSQNISIIDLSINECSNLSSEDTQSVNSDVISTDSQETSSAIEVSDNSSNNPLVITDIEDIEKLGFSKTDAAYLLIKAFLDGDTAAMEKISYFEAGVYDSYKSLKIGEYSIWLDENKTLCFSFNIIESGLDTLPVGWHTFYYDDYAIAWYINSDYEPIDWTSAYGAILRWGVLYLGENGIYDFSNPNLLVGFEKEVYLSCASNYIFFTHGELTLQEYQQYAQKITDIVDLQPSVDYETGNGTYGIPAHGGASWSHKIIDEKEENGITTITLQFYADWAETIKSHVIEYKLKNIDGDWVFIKSNFVTKSLYEPAYISV